MAIRFKRNGSVVVSKGHWYYYVKLPGSPRRRMLALRAPGAKHALPADRPRSMAEQAAARMWEEATRGYREDRRRDGGGATVEALAAAYLDHCSVYYRHADGTPTSETATVRDALRLPRELFGNAYMTEMCHADVLVIRDAIVRSGVSRVTVNRYLAIWKRMLAWALDEARVPAQVKSELTQVLPLKRGRSAARECTPVREVADDAVEAAISAMMPNTADLVRVQRLTGMRPGEACRLRWSRIDTTRTPWVYRPDGHKNDWRGDFGQPRVVLIGPKAREILGRHRDGGDIPFSPARAVAEWLRAKREAAVSPSRVSRADPHTPRKLGEAWDTGGLTRTIKYACQRAGVEEWAANRLRHTFATEVRRAFGLEACRAVLGHSSGSRITDRYSFAAIEDELIRAASPAVEALG